MKDSYKKVYWEYVNEFRRYHKGPPYRHQLYMSGDWVDVNFNHESNPLLNEVNNHG